MRAAAAGALTVVVVAVAAGGDGAGAQDRKPCDYGSHRPTPLRIGTLPAEVVPGRRVAYQVIARGYRGRLFGRGLTRLTIRFEQVDDGEETFSADRLRAYKRSKPGDNIGYDVRLLADSPGERVIVSWTDAGGSTPCTGELRSGDVRVAADRRPQRAVISSRAGVTDARRGDSSQLRISGRTRGCALTDPTRLTVVAKSASVTKRVRVDMACGAWTSHAPLRVDRFTLLPEDGAYAGAALIYVSPRAAPTVGARLSLAVYKGKRRLATREFRVAAGPKIVTG
jgi:hypothetical protein